MPGKGGTQGAGRGLTEHKGGIEPRVKKSNPQGKRVNWKVAQGKNKSENKKKNQTRGLNGLKGRTTWKNPKARKPSESGERVTAGKKGTDANK